MKVYVLQTSEEYNVRFADGIDGLEVYATHEQAQTAADGFNRAFSDPRNTPATVAELEVQAAVDDEAVVEVVMGLVSKLMESGMTKDEACAALEAAAKGHVEPVA
jgi:hypothetical protein